MIKLDPLQFQLSKQSSSGRMNSSKTYKYFNLCPICHRTKFVGEECIEPKRASSEHERRSVKPIRNFGHNLKSQLKLKAQQVMLRKGSSLVFAKEKLDAQSLQPYR